MKDPLKTCITCGIQQIRRRGVPAKCWDSMKCSMCYHESDEILLPEETIVERRQYNPFDFYLDKYTPQEMENLP